MSKTPQKLSIELFELITTNCSESIILVDANWKIIYFNPIFETFYLNDSHSNESADLPLSKYFKSIKDFEKLKNRAAKLKEDNLIEFKDEIPMKTNANIAEVRIRMVPTKIEEHDAEFMLFLNDVSEFNNQKYHQIMTEKLTLMDNLVRSIAHEVRNPLTNLTLALEQIEDLPTEEEEEFKEYTSIISRNAERISKLMNELMHSSRPKEMSFQEKSLNDIVQKVLELVEDRLKLKKIKVNLDLCKTDLIIQADEDQLQVAFLNLIVNAIEAMEEDKGILTIQTKAIYGQPQLRIKDNGSGLTDKVKGKLFEPFNTTKKEGTGLGLTLVQNIIHQHTGRISVRSKPGYGSSFFILFLNKEKPS